MAAVRIERTSIETDCGVADVESEVGRCGARDGGANRDAGRRARSDADQRAAELIEFGIGQTEVPRCFGAKIELAILADINGDVSRSGINGAEQRDVGGEENDIAV